MKRNRLGEGKFDTYPLVPVFQSTQENQRVTERREEGERKTGHKLTEVTATQSNDRIIIAW